MKVLVVDDQTSIRLLVRQIVEAVGADVIDVASGEEALDVFEAEAGAIDLVVMDVVMQGINGHQTAKQIRRAESKIRVPIIFLTSVQDEDVLIECLKYGDDYLQKPVNPKLLVGKLKVHFRKAHADRQLERSHKQLSYHNTRIRQEHDIVDQIFQSFAKSSHLDVGNIRHHISPMSTFNGDVFLTAVSEMGNQYVLVGDFTGHGLPSAIGSIPTHRTFTTMVQKCLPANEIVRELNRSLREMMPANMFFACILVEISRSGTSMSIWSGGMPEMLVCDESGVKHRVYSRHMPLGILEDFEFNNQMDFLPLEENDRIYLFTDGIIEANNVDGEMYGQKRVNEVLARPGEDAFNALLQDFSQFCQQQAQDDDVSLVEITAKPVEAPEATDDDMLQEERASALPWKLDIKLNARQLRQVEPVPQVIQLLSNAVGLRVHADFVSTILAELYANALEHGVLGLESDMKDDEDGFMEFYERRASALAELEDGWVSVHLEYLPSADTPAIIMRVTNSGPGFDYASLQAKAEADDDSEDAFGRGMMILNSLCKSVTFLDEGRTTEVVYEIH